MNRTRRSTAGHGPGETLEALGPYLTERAWVHPLEVLERLGTSWDTFTPDHAPPRDRWTEDAPGICDNHQRFVLRAGFLERADPIESPLSARAGRQGLMARTSRKITIISTQRPLTLTSYLYNTLRRSFLTTLGRHRRRSRREHDTRDRTNVFDQDLSTSILSGYAKTPATICSPRHRCHRDRDGVMYLLRPCGFRNT